MSLTLNDIIQARQRISGLVHTTPIITSSLLNHWLGHEIYFKAESVQKIGAFKARGGCNAISWLVESGQNPKHIIANSSGNHAQAIAYASHAFKIPATIYIPEDASSIKIQATKSYGAKVILSENRNKIDELAYRAANEPGTYWIPPYNHEQVIAGQGTVTLEALDQVQNIDAIFAPCGGGGLLSGTVIASHALSPSTRVFGVEPQAANDAAQSFRSGKIKKLEHQPNTIADGVKTTSVGEITFEYLKKLDNIFETSEANIIYWTQWLTHLLKINIEPSSALPMDGMCQWLRSQAPKKRVLVIITGGNLDQVTRTKIWEEDRLNILPSIN